MLSIRPILNSDKQFVVQALKNLWGSEQIVYSGVTFDAGKLPGFIAEENERIVGLVTFFLNQESLQIISINSLTPGKGIGTTLIEEVIKVAHKNGLGKILAVTTNDNNAAIEFYKKRGFTISKIKKGAAAMSRKVKPEIPLLGESGIPIEDEIELEMLV